LGHRCNLVLIEGGKTEVYYDHWAAIRLDEVVFWGPEHTRDFCRQRDSDDRPLLDCVWAEGGILLDWDKKVLLWYGGDNAQHNPFYHIAYLAILPENWPKWDVRWAFEGQLDIARYIGVPDNQILVENNERRSIKTPVIGEYDGERFLSANLVVSYVDGDMKGSSLLEYFDEVVAPLKASSPYEIRDLVNKSDFEDFPVSQQLSDLWEEGLSGGFHLDFDTQTIKIWHCAPEEGALDIVKANWPNWVVETDPNFSWHKELLPEWSWDKLGIPTARDLKRSYQANTGKEEENPALKLAMHMATQGQSNVRVSQSALESRNYYSPRPRGFWNRLKETLKRNSQ